MSWFAPTDEETAKRAKIREYFEPDKGSGALPFFALGATFTVLTSVLLRWDVPSEYLIGLGAIAAALLCTGGVLVYRRMLRASDEEIDVWREEDFDAVIADVPEQAGFDSRRLIQSDDPIVIVGFVRFDKLESAFPKQNGAPRKAWRFKVKVGKDGITRWTPPSLVVLHHTTNQLIAYQCDVDLLSGAPLNESVAEYFWKDIVSLQVEKESVSWAQADDALVRQWARSLPKAKRRKYQALLADKPKNLGAASYDRRTVLRLRTSGDCGLEIVLADRRFVASGSDPASLEGKHANGEAITRLRKLLRDQNLPSLPATRKVLLR